MFTCTLRILNVNISNNRNVFLDLPSACQGQWKGKAKYSSGIIVGMTDENVRNKICLVISLIDQHYSWERC